MNGLWSGQSMTRRSPDDGILLILDFEKLRSAKLQVVESCGVVDKWGIRAILAVARMRL